MTERERTLFLIALGGAMAGLFHWRGHRDKIYWLIAALPHFMNLTTQQQKVYDYILAHPGCTTRDIQHDTFITCPSGRITELRQAGVPIVSIGHKKYPGAHAFEMYMIDVPKPAQKQAETSEQAKQLPLAMSV